MIFLENKQFFNFLQLIFLRISFLQMYLLIDGIGLQKVKIIKQKVKRYNNDTD